MTGLRPSRCLRAGLALALTAVALIPRVALAAPPDEAERLVRAAVDYWRDVSSYSVAEMHIHRPDWQRSYTLRIWTRGEKHSLVRVVAPPKDAGSGTLLIDNDMWSYTPKINRVIKIPSSMMSQSWLGSDFSNNDLAKADELIEQYSHRLVATEKRDGHTVHVVESTPKETAPVPWGKEIVRIRDDHVLLEHAFFDQDLKPVKTMVTSELKPMGGKIVATRQRMTKVDRPDEWTEVVVREARFGLRLPDLLFTQAHLSNPREP